jgi:hypothetical protein
MDEDQCKRLTKQRAVAKGMLTRMQDFIKTGNESDRLTEVGSCCGEEVNTFDEWTSLTTRSHVVIRTL